MKIYQAKAEFRPVTITLETEEDLSFLIRAMISYKNEPLAQVGTTERVKAVEFFNKLADLR